MNTFVALLMLSLAVTSMPLGAADEAAKKPAAVKTSAGKSMDPAKGRFHQRHNKKLGMECGTCHSGEAQDTLFLRKDEALPVGMPAPVDRSVCLGCHQGSAKPAWYGLK